MLRQLVLLAAAAWIAALAFGTPAGAEPEGRPGRKDGIKDRTYFEERGDIVWEVASAREKLICLTFDDGPDPEQTPAILDLLRTYGAHATFFVTGVQAKQHPELLLREVQEGHEIGNHTYHHKFFRRPSAETVLRELSEAEQVIVTATGKKPHLFRPPGGYYDQTIVDASREAGYRIILWSWHEDTKDWARPGVGRIAGKVLGNARPGDIVLLHDHVERTQTIAALEQILPELQHRGYRFVTVSELLRSAHVDGHDASRILEK
jgi:polysaccharide deacetylase family sporulation protein PdaB